MSGGQPQKPEPWSRAGEVLATLGGALAGAVAVGCCSLGLWDLILMENLGAERAAFEMAARLDDIYIEVFRPDVVPAHMAFGKVVVRLLVLIAVAVPAYLLLRRAGRGGGSRTRPAVLLVAIVVCAPWLLNVRAVVAEVTGATAQGRVALALALSSCVAVSWAIERASEGRQAAGIMLGSAGALLGGVAVYILRSQVHWLFQVACVAAVAALFALVSRQSSAKS
jgi:tryptophan-rich sensory protein